MHHRLGLLGVLVACAVTPGADAQQAPNRADLEARLEQQGGRVIVGLRPAGARLGMRAPGVRGLSVTEAARLADGLQASGFTPARHFRIITAVSGTIAPGKLRALRAHPNVEYVQPDFINRPLGRPSRPTVETAPWGIRTVRAAAAWTATTPPSYGAGVKVGVMDTGGDPLHEDLVYAGGYDAISDSTAPAYWRDRLPECGGHGTHVGGTVAARRDNGVGVVGVAPEASLYALKIFQGDGFDCWGYTSDELKALDWAVQNGIEVINMSFGKGGYDPAEHQAIQAAVAQGVVVVAAAGNTGGPVIYPAANPEVIAVAATDSLEQRAFFSSRGSEVDVAAPGVFVLSTLPNNQYDFYDGTSMASPHVTGLAALLRAVDSTLTVSQVRTYITAWAADRGAVGVDDDYGHGRVDALASVTALMGSPPPTLLITRQPDGATSGQPLTQQPIVQLADAAGQPVALAGVPVSASIASGSGRITTAGTRSLTAVEKKGVLPANQLMVAVVTDASGTATFSNLRITGVGPQVMEFSAPGHVAVQSQPFTASAPALTDGVPLTGVSGPWNTRQYWSFTVPPEAVSVTFTTGGGAGDPDLFVRRGAVPDFGNWDCASYGSTTTESCSLSGAVAGEWYVLLYAYGAFSGVTLLADWRDSRVASALGLAQEPGSAPAGQPLLPQPVVELRDSQGVPVQQAGIWITVSAVGPGTATDFVAPFLSAVTDAQGRATFDGLGVTAPGTHSLVFTAGALAAATSQSITVLPQLPTFDGLVTDLLGTNQLSPEQEAYLDARGNADGVFNLGDFLAFFDRGGHITAAAPPPRAATRRRP